MHFKHWPARWNVSDTHAHTHTLSLHLPASWGLLLMNCEPICVLCAWEHCTCVPADRLLGNLGLQVTWLLLWVWRCSFLSFLLLPVYIFIYIFFIFSLTGEVLQVLRSLQVQIWKLWTPGFSLLDYLWIYLRVPPHFLSRLQLWAFLTSKELLRPRRRNLAPSLQKSSMSARPRWPSWSCGCTKPVWHSSRKL